MKLHLPDMKMYHGGLLRLVIVNLLALATLAWVGTAIWVLLFGKLHIAIAITTAIFGLPITGFVFWYEFVKSEVK